MLLYLTALLLLAITLLAGLERLVAQQTLQNQRPPHAAVPLSTGGVAMLGVLGSFLLLISILIY